MPGEAWRSIKRPKVYEDLRSEGMSKSKAAAISNSTRKKKTQRKRKRKR